MISSKDYQELDGVALAQGIHERKFTAAEVIDCAIRLAESLNPQLNAISWQTYQQAHEQAQKLDGKRAKSKAPLSGVPFLIKDVSPVKGLPQTCHSRLFDGEIGDHNAPIVDQFQKAGLLSLGKTNTPELCLTITTESVVAGACHNPWDVKHSTGGSSGGSAAAVAARIVPIAHASDGGGSIRIPASCCGVFGLKPSRGLTPVEPQLGASWSGMSVGHVVSRSVRDSAAVLDAIRLHQPVLYPLPPSPESYQARLQERPTLRLAFQYEHPFGAPIHPEVKASLRFAADVCKQLGFEVTDAVPPIDYQALTEHTSLIVYTHVAQSVVPQLAKRGLDFDTELLEEGSRRMAKRGAQVSAVEYLAAIDGTKTLALQMDEFHRSYDILVSPVITQPPAELGWLDMNSNDMNTYIKRFNSYSGFCALFNATGQPSMSVPLHQTANGLPVGVMFSAGWGSDLELLQLAYRLEQEINWDRRRPLVR